MRALAASGVGLLLVTHHLDDIIPEIERVVLLRTAAVARDGPKQQLLTSERLSEVFGAPVDVVRARRVLPCLVKHFPASLTR